jgi:hypothetical protein
VHDQRFANLDFLVDIDLLIESFDHVNNGT